MYVLTDLYTYFLRKMSIQPIVEANDVDIFDSVRFFRVSRL